MTTITILGSSLTGTNGQTNRTYTVVDTKFNETDMQVFINGMYAYKGIGKTYTVSENTITFLTAIFDIQIIDIIYNRDLSVVPIVTTDYATSEQLSDWMMLSSNVPNHENNSYELIGTGDTETVRFWLDHVGVFPDTLVLYYGPDETDLTELDLDDDYTFDSDTSLITLTSAGETKLAEENLYGEYKYNFLGITHNILSRAINNAVGYINLKTYNNFVDGTDETPNWTQYIDKVYDGQGTFISNYSLGDYPLPTFSTQLDGDVASDDTTITVKSTNGFPESGNICIDDDKITYTGKTSTTFTGCTSVSAHSDGDTVKPYVIESSDTHAGGEITWEVLKEGTDYDLNLNTGRLHLYTTNYRPTKYVPNRIRASFLIGTSNIPQSITDLMSIAVRKAHTTGNNKFNPSLLNVDEEKINELILQYKNEKFEGC